MSVSAGLASETPLSHTLGEAHRHISKRRKLSHDAERRSVNIARPDASELDDEPSVRAGDGDEGGQTSLGGIRPHPLDIKPLGNAFGAAVNVRTRAGHFQLLPDEIIQQILELLGAHDLLRLGATCRALYAFCWSDDLWRSLFLAGRTLPPEWRGTWRSTYLALPANISTHIVCSSLYSDVLYRPFQCANVPLDDFVGDIPSSNTISRLSDLTASEFNAAWASKPFILTSPVRAWPAYRDWTTTALLSAHGATSFRAEAVDWPLSTYISYARNTTDESPLYLFDCDFARKMSLPQPTSLSSPYAPPAFASPMQDLFTHLGSTRPDHSWLIIGPPRSGSTFHKDPNGTSAWNAVLRGRKYWIMFPPTSKTQPPPPGVFVSEDQSTVTAPLSIAEWLLGFHAEARRTKGCVEAVCEQGEVLHVPAGWYHLVVNLPDGHERGDDVNIALTGNFVPRAHLVDVLEFFRDRGEQVSGFRNDESESESSTDKEQERYFEMFTSRLRQAVPDILDKALAELSKRDSECAVTGKKGTKWEELVHGPASVNGADGNEGPGAFSFGFGIEEEEEEVQEETAEGELGEGLVHP